MSDKISPSRYEIYWCPHYIEGQNDDLSISLIGNYTDKEKCRKALDNFLELFAYEDIQLVELYDLP